MTLTRKPVTKGTELSLTFDKTKIYRCTKIYRNYTYFCRFFFFIAKLGHSHWGRSFENRALRRIFGPKKEEVTEESRRLHKEELYALYSSPYIIRVIKSRRLRWGEHVARMRARRGKYRVLMGKPRVKRPIGKPRRRWEDNNKMDLRKAGLGGGGHRLDRCGWGQEQMAISCECGNELSGSIKWGKFLL